MRNTPIFRDKIQAIDIFVIKAILILSHSIKEEMKHKIGIGRLNSRDWIEKTALSHSMKQGGNCVNTVEFYIINLQIPILV